VTWETVPLGNVARYIRGVTYKPGDVVGAEDGVPCLRTKNVQGTLDLSDLIYVRTDVRHRAEQVVQSNDVLVSSANSWHLVGRAVQATSAAQGMLVGGFIGSIRFDSQLIDPRYGFHWFSSPEVQTRVRSFGQQTTNIANLNVDRTLGLNIPLPPLPEQRRIAAILDEADALRIRNRAATQHLNELRRAAIHRAIRDVRTTKPLGDVAVLYGGASLPAGLAFSGQADGYLLLKVSDLNAPGNELSVSTALAWSPAAGARSSTAPTGSIVIPKRGASIATNKKRILRRPAILDPNLMGIEPLDQVVSAEWLHAWFETVDLASLQSGSSVPQLNKQDLVHLAVPLPPMAHQRQFAAADAQIAERLAHHQLRAKQVDCLFASLQHRAFRGEL
jgi:type I restriction enzyme S subunit